MLCKDEKLTLLGIAVMALCALNVIFKLCFSVEEMKTLPAGLMIAYALAGTAVFVLYGIRAFRYLLGKCGGAEDVASEDGQSGAENAEDFRQGGAENACGESAAHSAARKKELSEIQKNAPAEGAPLFGDSPLAGI